MKALRPVKISGLSTYVPPKVLSNADLEKLVETSNEWILQRTGIRERHIADPGVATSDLAKEAALGAIQQAGISPDQLGFIVVGTTTPDTIFPSTACMLQHKIGAHRAWGYDLGAACSGFTYAVTAGMQLVATGAHDHVLAVGADVMSSIIDYTDRTTCVLFGDGAGAVVLEAQPQHGTNKDRGILASRLRSDGRFEDLLYVDGGPGSTRTTGHLRMNGREVFRHAVQKISGVIEETLVMSGFAADEIDLFIPHQANARILDGIAKKLGVSPEKIVVTLGQHGNTSAASIPLALNHAFEHHLIKEGSLILMEAMGGGFTWGAALARW